MRHGVRIASRILPVAILLASCADVAAPSTNLQGIELVQAGDYVRAEPALLRALRSAERNPQSLQTSTVRYNLGWLYRLEGRYSEAEPLLRQAVLTQERLGSEATRFLPTTLNEYGYLLLLEGRLADAEPLFRRALTMQEQSAPRDDTDQAKSLENLGYAARLQERYAEARQYYQRALSIREHALGPNNPAVARTLSNLGTLLVLQGRPADAEPLEQRALHIREVALGPQNPQVADSLYDLGNLYRAQRRFAESEVYFRRAIALDKAAAGPRDPLIATRGYAGLVRLYDEQGKVSEALAASSRATDILAQLLADGRGQRSVAAATERRLYRDIFVRNIALTFADAQRNGGDPAPTSFNAAQYAAVTTAGQAVAHMAAQFAAQDSTLAAEVRHVQDLDDRWRQLDDQLVKDVSTTADRDASKSESLRASLESTDRELTALAAQVAQKFPQYADITNAAALPLGQVERLLAPDEAMLVYVTAPDATWLWAVRNGSAHLYRLDISADELAASVTALRGFLDPDTNPTLRPFPAKRSYALYQRILAPAEPFFRGAHNLLVVPDGALASLPLSVLVTDSPQQDPAAAIDHRNVHWLAKDYAVSVLPSVASLRSLRTFAHNSSASSPFLGIGNPALSGSEGGPSGGRGIVAGLGPVLSTPLQAGQVGSARDPGETRRAVSALSPLPETATELHAIAQIEHASDRDLLLGRQANERELRDAPLSRYRIVEFATHGLKPGDLGLAEPALVLTPTGQTGEVDDGLLTASKIATLKLDADWVVLSACNTGVSADGRSEGFSALATAFFHAGARSVLISHWSVPSGPTVLLTAGAFAALADNPGIGRSEALRRSMMAMLDPSRPPEFAHPLVWAPFSLAGDAGNERALASVP